MKILLNRLLLGLLCLTLGLWGVQAYTDYVQAQTTAHALINHARWATRQVAQSLPEPEANLLSKEWASDLLALPGLEYWALLRKDGNLIVSGGQVPQAATYIPVVHKGTQESIQRDKLLPGLPREWLTLPTKITIDHPVYKGEQEIILRTIFDLSEAYRHWQKVFYGTGLFACIVFALTTLLLWLFYRIPLLALRDATRFAQNISAGNTQARSPVHSGIEEIEVLRQSLEDLHSKLQEQRAAMLASESKYRNAIDELEAVVFQINGDLTWSFLSTGWLRMTGLTPSESIGQHFSTAFSDADQQRVSRAAMALIQGEQREYRDEVMLLRADGVLVEVEIAMHLFCDEQGHTLGATGTLSDYSKRRAHELEIARQRRLFQQIIDHLPVSIYVKNEQSDYVLVNDQGARVLGCTPEQLVGKTDRDFLLPDSAALRYAEDREVLRTGIPVAREQMVSINGEIRHWLGRKVRLDAGNGTLLVLQAAIDITERKKAEIELQRQRELIERVIETDPTLIFVKDEKYRFVMINTAFARAFNLPRESFLGKRFDEIHSIAEEIESVYWSDRRTLEKGEEISAEITFTRNDGQHRHFLSITKPLTMPDGRIHILGIQQDITDLKHHEDALLEQTRRAEAASRAKSEFLANMSHEIRTPMNGIIGMTDLTLNTPLTEEQRQYLLLARASANSLLSIINEVLDFSKIEAGRMAIEYTPFEFYHLIAEITKPLALQAHSKGLCFFVKVPHDLPNRLIGDPTRLKQVLVNLIGNAVKFTSEGQVTLTIDSISQSTQQSMLRFSVRDTGVGIPVEKQGLIFEAFEQADGSTTRKYGGTGLGLTISSRLVELMGSKINLKSRVGVGSEFSFDLVFSKENVQKHEEEYAHYASLAGISVAWIDANEERASWFAAMAHQWQANISRASSVEAAVALLTKHTFDVVLLDDELPPPEARALVSALRSRSNSTRLILLSRAFDKSLGRLPEIALNNDLDTAGEIYLRLIKPIMPLELNEALSRTIKKNSSIVAAPTTPYAVKPVSRYILLAEDNYVNQVLAVSMLEKLEHVVDIANDGFEALEKLDSNTYDLVLMDVQMPNMGGLEATRAWRERERTRGLKPTPIIAMTAHTMRGDRERCLESGMDGYVSKPFHQSTLCSEIDRVMSGIPADIQPSASQEATENSALDNQFSRTQSLAVLQYDEHLLERVAKVYLQAVPGVHTRLAEAVKGKDAKNLRRVAHEIKGMAYNLGAKSLGETAAQIEKLASEERIEDALSRYQRLIAQFEAVTNVMREIAAGSDNAAG